VVLAVLAAALVMTVMAGPARAASLTVTTTADEVNAPTLRARCARRSRTRTRISPTTTWVSGVEGDGTGDGARRQACALGVGAASVLEGRRLRACAAIELLAVRELELWH
jgi:hypothetical protein